MTAEAWSNCALHVLLILLVRLILLVLLQRALYEVTSTAKIGTRLGRTELTGAPRSTRRIFMSDCARTHLPLPPRPLSLNFL